MADRFLLGSMRLMSRQGSHPRSSFSAPGEGLLLAECVPSQQSLVGHGSASRSDSAARTFLQRSLHGPVLPWAVRGEELVS